MLAVVVGVFAGIIVAIFAVVIVLVGVLRRGVVSVLFGLRLIGVRSVALTVLRFFDRGLLDPFHRQFGIVAVGGIEIDHLHPLSLGARLGDRGFRLGLGGHDRVVGLVLAAFERDRDRDRRERDDFFLSRSSSSAACASAKTRSSSSSASRSATGIW